MPAGKKHTLLGRTVQGKSIFFQGLTSIVFQEASNYSIDYGHFDYGTYGNAVAFVQEPSVDTIINYVISLGAGKRLWTFSPTNPALPVLEIILDFPGTNTENAPPYKPIWYLSYSLGDFGGGHPPFSPNGTVYNITVNSAVTCYNSDAQVLMEGWYAGPRTLTRQSETLYVYGDETLYRADTVSPWSYANLGSPFVTSLTVAPFPWQAEWPSPYTATKTCPTLTVPGAPILNLATCPIDEVCNTLKLNFSAPTSDGGSPITDYEYSFSTSGPWISLNTIETDANIYVYDVPDIAGRTKDVYVRAVNAIGAGIESNNITFECRTCVPTAPTNVVVSDGGNCILTVYYEEPQISNGTILYYELCIDEAGDSWTNIGFNGLVYHWPFEYPQGENGRIFYVRVRAVNSSGAGDASNMFEITIPGCA